MITRPLLASKLEDVDSLKWPQAVSWKLDGIRVIKIDGKVVTRKFKPVPNTYIRNFLERHLPDNIDGEIMINQSSPTKKSAGFNNVQSQVMSKAGQPDFQFYAFDYVKDSLDKPYLDRIKDLRAWHLSAEDEVRVKVKVLYPELVENLKDLQVMEQKAIDLGHEGLMLRSPDSRYKCGKSTAKEGILLKMKRFLDAEAIVIGFEEEQSNTNEKEKDELGLSKRSSKKAGKVPAGTLGALLMKSLDGKMSFGIGIGFDDETRKTIWDNRSKYLGKIASYKYQEIGKSAPRFPVFLTFRSKLDL